MKLEAQTMEKIKSRINAKVMAGSGTWIDWQYLMDASSLLAKCRYTLQYTYPYAYYMPPGSKKELVRLLNKGNTELTCTTLCPSSSSSTSRPSWRPRSRT